MKNNLLVMGLVALGLLVASCSSYSGATSNGKRVYFVKNTTIGPVNLPSIEVCDVGGTAGLTNCRSAIKK